MNDVQQIQRGYKNLAEEQWRRGEIPRALDAYEAARCSTQRSGGHALLRWLDGLARPDTSTS